MNSTTIPAIRYQDANAAIDWLCKAFGFKVFLKVPGEGDRIEHARLTLDTNMVMLASIDRDGPFEQQFTTPAKAGGITQGLFIITDNPDPIHQTAIAAGATVVDPIADTQFGRTFSCLDLESHLWTFTTHDPWHKAW